MINKLYQRIKEHKVSIAFCLAGIVVLVVTGSYSINPIASNDETHEDASKLFNAVTALGRIEPQGGLIRIAPAPEPGGAKVSKLLVGEGDSLVEGEVIALLGNHRRAKSALLLAHEDVKVAQAELAIVRAGAKESVIDAQVANLNRIKAELDGELLANNADIARLKAQLETEQIEKQSVIDRSQAELANAKSEFQRYQQLAENGAISNSELDSRRLNLSTAENTLTAALSSYEFTTRSLEQQVNRAVAITQKRKDTLREQIKEAEATLVGTREIRGVDVVRAQTEVDRTMAALRQTKDNLELTVVRAPTDGQIVKIITHPGEVVGRDGLVEFAQTKNMMIVAEVYESDIGKVVVGQIASINSETGAFTRELTGKVSHIGWKVGKQDVLNTDPAADVDSRVVEVNIHLNSETSKYVARLSNAKAIVKIHL